MAGTALSPLSSWHLSDIKTVSLAALKLNDPHMTKLGSIFRDYENYALSGHPSSGNNDCEKKQEVLRITRRLAEVLETNVSLKEFTLNLQAISESLGSSKRLAKFMQDSPSLENLQIRIPSGSKSTDLFSRKIICPKLRELTIWVARDRPRRLHLAFMRNAAALRRPHTLRCRSRRPVNFHKSYAESSRQFNLRDIAKFIANQPNLKYLRIQTSTLTMDQWTTLTNGISANRSLKHVEFRRLEADSHAVPFSIDSLAKHPTIEWIDLNGCPTTFDWYQLSGRNTNVGRLSWSSSPMKLECVRQLTSLLATQKTRITQLEVSHANLSGPKIMLIAQMMQDNTSIRELNLSKAQLIGMDGWILAKGLQSNSTLKKLSLNDNWLFKGYCDLAFQGFGALLASPLCNLEVFDLSNNDMNPVDHDLRFSQLFEGMRHNSKLKILKLSNRGTLFCETMHTNHWEASLSHHVQVSHSLGNALRNCHLTELNLNHHRLDNRGIATYLAPALSHNCQLKLLALKRIGMGDEAMIALSKALMGNLTLKYLDVSYNCDMSHVAFRHFVPCLETLSELHTFLFHSNREESFACIVATALRKQYSLIQISEEHYLEPSDQFWLVANRHGRKLLHNGDVLHDSLWPTIFGNCSGMPEILALFVRENANLLAGTSLMPNPLAQQPAEIRYKKPRLR